MGRIMRKWETGGQTAGINLCNETEEVKLKIMHTEQKSITKKQEKDTGN